MRNKLFFVYGLVAMLWAMLSVHDSAAFLLGYGLAFVVPCFYAGMYASYKAKKTGKDQAPDYLSCILPSVIAASIMWGLCLIMHWHC